MKFDRLLPLLLLCASAACTVPTLAELEKDRARECDDSHPCLPGYSCQAGFCRVGTFECSPGATEACGNDKGECVPGQRTCQQDGTWGTCTGEVGPVAEVCDGKDNDCDDETDEGAQTNACGLDLGVCQGAKKACLASGSEETACPIARYGNDFQLGTEDRCDGKDNDCDGQTDEALVKSCGIDAGVCAGATQSCRDGGFGGCGTADFLQNNSAYEPYESKCDSLDNDCDRLTDSWAERIISDAGIVARRGAVGVALADAGNGSQRDVLAFYEDGTRVMMRQLRADGTLGPPTPPTQGGGSRAYQPTLATDGMTVVAAWFDELTGAGGAKTYRIYMGLPRPDGVSLINGSPGTAPLNLSGEGLSLSLAVGGGRIALAWGWDEAGANRVTIANCPLTFSTPCAVTTLNSTAARKPRVAINPSGVQQYVTYETTTNNRISLVVADYTAPSGVPTLIGQAPVTISLNDGESNPWVLYDPVADRLRLYFFDTARTRIRGRTCSLPCTTPDTGSTPASSTFPIAATRFTLAGSANSPIAVIDGSYFVYNVVAWEELNSGATGYEIVTSTSDDAYRGWPVITTRPGGAPTFTVLFDDEDSSGDGVIRARRYCGP